MRILITGVAGFIGFHVAKTLLRQGIEVHGYDNENSYYNTAYKTMRLDILRGLKGFSYTKGDLENLPALRSAFMAIKPTHVLHLAAQAGVRYSIDNPMVYIQSNIVGFQNILELLRVFPVENFVFASSSSVYGGSKVIPFSESQRVDNPVSLYAATKVANEVFARTYSNMFNISAIGLRFFTVYGPYGRPDMALFKFARAIREGESIELYNSGNMIRDFTYIDDIVDGVISALRRPRPWAIYNLGRGKPEILGDMVKFIETSMGKKAHIQNHPMQLGDLEVTHADISLAKAELNYHPKVNLAEGIGKFIAWHKEFALD
jgi:UDP-glucuronate 4-epimerase